MWNFISPTIFTLSCSQPKLPHQRSMFSATKEGNNPSIFLHLFHRSQQLNTPQLLLFLLLFSLWFIVADNKAKNHKGLAGKPVAPPPSWSINHQWATLHYPLMVILEHNNLFSFSKLQNIPRIFRVQYSWFSCPVSKDQQAHVFFWFKNFKIKSIKSQSKPQSTNLTHGHTIRVNFYNPLCYF